MYSDGIVQLKDKEFRLISDLVYRAWGINLSDRKKELVHGRLHKIVKSEGYSSFEEYYKAVVGDRTGNGLLALIDRISTNHTFFFRESEHFEFLANRAIPALNECRDRENEIRIWCAGCASGEEAYSLAMVMNDYLSSNHSLSCRILATDISVSALERARAGVYSGEKLNSIPRKYHGQFRRNEAGESVVRDELKKLVTFKRLNLMRDAFPFGKKFHIIFCRNVMIYFDVPTRERLLKAFHAYMSNDGFLFVGHSESLNRESALFESVFPSVYRKRGWRA